MRELVKSRLIGWRDEFVQDLANKVIPVVTIALVMSGASLVVFVFGTVIYSASIGGLEAQTLADTDTSAFVEASSLPVPAYASLYEMDSSCTTVINTGTAGTFVPWTTAATFNKSSNVTVDLGDASGDSITVPSTGPYLIGFSVSFKGPTTADYEVAITVDGTPTNHRSTRSGSLANAVGAFGSPLVHTLTAGSKVRLAFDADVNAEMDLCNVALSFGAVGGIPQQ